MKTKFVSFITILTILLSQSVPSGIPDIAFASGTTTATEVGYPTASTGSWTASNDRYYSGTEVDNIGIGGYTGFGINDPTAQNGKPAGQYLMLPESVFPYDASSQSNDLILPDGTGNVAFANAKMAGLGFNITGGTYNGQPAYSASDIYTLSGLYIANQQAYYSSGQTVDTQPYPKPSISISNVSQSQNLQANQTITVNDSYGTSDNVPTAWGSNAGILAYWYFNGGYTNVFANSSNESIPAYGFTPYGTSDSYQPGVSPTTSFQATVPANASGSGTLYVYYVDGIDRYAETSVPVTVSGPTLTLTVSPTTSQNTNSTFTLTANTTNANGDFVQFTTQTTSGSPINNAGPGTLSGNGQSNQTSLSYNLQTTASYQYQPTATSSQTGSETITATLISPTAGQLAQKSVTVTWTTPPAEAITLSASTQEGSSGSNVTTYAGEPITLTATGKTIQSGDTITIMEKSSRALYGSLSSLPITESTSQMNGSVSLSPWTATQAYTSYNVNGYADSTAQAPQTITYEAIINNPTTGVSNTATATATWQAPTMSITSNVTTATVNTDITFMGTSNTLPPSGDIYIHESGSGTNIGLSPASTTSSIATTNSYYAATQIEGYTYSSGTVSASWTDLPTITLTASASQAYPNNTVTLTATFAPSSDMPASVPLYIHDTSLYATLNGGNSNVASGSDGQNPFSTLAEYTSQLTSDLTTTYQAAIYYNGQYLHSNVVSVTWLPTPAGSGGTTGTLSVTVNGQTGNITVPVGTAVSVAATSTYTVGTNKAIYLHDGGMNTFAPDPFEGSLGSPTVSTTAIMNAAGSATYSAALQLTNGTYVSSNNITVTWSTSSTGTGSGGGSGSGTTCPNPPNTVTGPIPPEPQNYVMSSSWSVISPSSAHPEGGDQLSWTDTLWVLQSSTSTINDSNGCPETYITYNWVDQPEYLKAYYYNSLKLYAVSGVLDDPGTPSNPWLPSKRGQADQGSQITGQEPINVGGSVTAPIYGNVNVGITSPVLYLRSYSAFGTQWFWQGAPSEIPSSGTIMYTTTNPDGNYLTKSYAMQVNPATITGSNYTIQIASATNPDNPVAGLSANGAPDYATGIYSEASGFLARHVPTSSGEELVAWNTTGNPATAAKLGLNIRLLNGDGYYVAIADILPDFAQFFNYPVYTLIHQTCPNTSGTSNCLGQ